MLVVYTRCKINIKYAIANEANVHDFCYVLTSIFKIEVCTYIGICWELF